MNEGNDSKSVTRKWNIVSDQSKAYYAIGNEVIYDTEVLKSNLWNFSYANIKVTGNITVLGNNGTQAHLKMCLSSKCFNKSLAKINGTTINDAEDLDLVMSSILT